MNDSHYGSAIVGTGSAACLLLGPGEHEEQVMSCGGGIGLGASLAERES